MRLKVERLSRSDHGFGLVTSLVRGWFVEDRRSVGNESSELTEDAIDR